MVHADALRSILRVDKIRLQLLTQVRALRLPDCWIGAGFVRNAVWDHLHARPPAPPAGDIDVIWFDRMQPAAARDLALEEALRAAAPCFEWSVKNQARMHERNNDPPYETADDAMRFWPETATAIAARLTNEGEIDIAAPYGLTDLFDLLIRAAPCFSSDKVAIVRQRASEKNWLEKWPRLRFA